MHFLEPIFATYLPHLIHLDFINLIVFAEKSTNYEVLCPTTTYVQKKNVSVNCINLSLKSFVWNH
jgi:hypothetical protein